MMSIDRLRLKIKGLFLKYKSKRVASVFGLFVISIVLVGLVLFVFNLIKGDKDVENANQNDIISSYQKSIPELQQKVQQNPEDATLRKDLSVAYYATGNLESAKDNYTVAVELNPNDYVLQNNLGNVYRDLGQFQKAVDLYITSIELQPQQVNAYLNLANIYIYSLEQFEEGIAIYDKAIRHMPDRSDEFLLQKGNAYKNNGNIEKAKSIYQEILGTNPNNSAAKSLLNSL